MQYNITFKFYKDDDVNQPFVYIRMEVPDHHYYYIKCLYMKEINTYINPNVVILTTLSDMINKFKRNVINNG